MVQKNLTRDITNSLKKTRSVASALVKFSDIPLTADDYEIFNIPVDAVITDTIVVVTKAFNATATLDVGFDGGAELFAAAVISSVAVVADSDSNIATVTGKRITVTPSINVTQGEAIIIVEYVEYDLANGDLTTFSDTP